MIIDSHAHFEPRMLGLDDAVAKMDAAGVDKVALIPAMNDTLPHTPEMLLTVVRKLMRSPLSCASRRFRTSWPPPSNTVSRCCASAAPCATP